MFGTATYHLTLRPGATFVLPIRGITDVNNTPMDLTGCQIRSSLREHYTDGQPAAVMTLAVLDLSVSEFDMIISAAETDRITMTEGVWDLEVQFPNNTVWRLLEGKVFVKPSATRE